MPNLFTPNILLIEHREQHVWMLTHCFVITPSSLINQYPYQSDSSFITLSKMVIAREMKCNLFLRPFGFWSYFPRCPSKTKSIASKYWLKRKLIEQWQWNKGRRKCGVWTHQRRDDQQGKSHPPTLLWTSIISSWEVKEMICFVNLYFKVVDFIVLEKITKFK